MNNCMMKKLDKLHEVDKFLEIKPTRFYYEDTGNLNKPIARKEIESVPACHSTKKITGSSMVTSIKQLKWD